MVEKQKGYYQDDQLNSETLTPETLVLHLIYSNDYETLKEYGVKNRNMNFLEHFVEVEIDNRITPLICASYLGRVEIVKLLLENEGIDVDQASDENGHTPLSTACLAGNYEVVRVLLQANAEVNKPTAFNHTPIICCFARLEEEINVFENRKICLKMAELLLQHGADINWIVDKKKGYTLLMQLCSTKMELCKREKEINYELVKFLLENGADKKLASFKNKSSYELTNKHSNGEQLKDLLVNCQQQFFYKKEKKPLGIKKLNSEESTAKNDDKKGKKKGHKKSNSLAKFLNIFK